MQFIIFFALAVAWAVVLGPDLLKRRGGGSRSFRSSGRGLSLGLGLSLPSRKPAPMSRSLSGAVGGGGVPMGSRIGARSSVVPFPTAPGTQSRARVTHGPVRRRRGGIGAPPASALDAARRRIYVLSILIAAAVLSLSVAIGVWRPFLFVHFVIDLALAVYVYMLFEMRAQAAAEDDELEDELDVDDDGEEYESYQDSDDVAVGQS